jgi:L-ascorbate metabolism protein UlaG (beta-lactamase superfamily)
MMGEKLYLRPNIQVEPLVDRWYAWSHLVPPATAARNLTERHLKIMESYVNAPQVHASAVRNPKMLGGPFIDYDGKRTEEIRALIASTKKERVRLLELSAAIQELDGMLRSCAHGHSLQPLYSKVPPCLRGYVELVYDLNHHPSFRLLESLLYRSPYFERSAQSLMLSVICSDDRPFVLSTPRLDIDDGVLLQIPFDDPSVDALFSLKKNARSWMDIQRLLPVDSNKMDLFKSFFTAEPEPPYQNYAGDRVRWRYFGHACILIETREMSMLFDPVLSYTYENAISRYTYQNLPDKIDYVLITHNHQDHVLFETLLQIRHKVGQIIVPRSGNGHLQDPSLKLILENCGFSNVIELGEMESIQLEHGDVMALPFIGEHADLDIPTKSAYLVRITGRSLLFAADSCNVEPALYEHIHQATGDVDVLFAGMECDGAPLSWLYGPLATQPVERAADHSRRLSGSDCEQVLAMVEQFRCTDVYVYAMGQEPWLNYIMSLKYTAESRPICESNKLIDACRARGILAERLYGEKEILLEPRTKVMSVA